MKTAKFFSVLSLAIIFTSVTFGSSNGLDNRNSQVSIMPGITYQVVIHFSGFTKDICNPYLVQILDETGRLVAPAQVFIKGINKYVFYEKGPALGRIRMGPFKSGQTYSFDLYPTIEGQRID